MDTWVQGIGLAIMVTGLIGLSVSVVMFAKSYFGDTSRGKDEHDARSRSA